MKSTLHRIIVAVTTVCSIGLPGCWPVSKAVDKKMGIGHSALHDAASKGDLDGVQKALSPKKGSGDDVNRPHELRYTKGLEKWTPLMHAAGSGHLDVVRYLLDNGAGIDIRDRFGMTALGIAIDEKHLDVAEELLRRGANPRRGSQANGPPINSAVRRGDVHGVKLLLRYGVVPYQRIGRHPSAIEVAKSSNQPEILAVLLADKDSQVE